MFTSTNNSLLLNESLKDHDRHYFSRIVLINKVSAHRTFIISYKQTGGVSIHKDQSIQRNDFGQYVLARITD